MDKRQRKRQRPDVCAKDFIRRRADPSWVKEQFVDDVKGL